jgi:cytochrome c peroxidase
MNSVTRHLLIFGFFLVHASPSIAGNLREEILREQALKNGITPTSSMNVEVDPALAGAGALLFESKKLSLTENISCQTCHLDDRASTDGLPNAAGVGAEGHGTERLLQNGAIIPRNALAMWGRGSPEFLTFFWDGKVVGSGKSVESQFGADVPSEDPLNVAVRLPIVEVDEMLDRQESISLGAYEESVAAAEKIYELIEERIRSDDILSGPLSDAFDIKAENIEIDHIADALSAHIRNKFRIKDTKFHKFVFEGGNLSSREIAGGLLFYGKGQCAQCHSGSHFSDFQFHAMPFPQLGFGKNGFGVDYGRYNVTLDPVDLYKFRTPPLINVTRTAPYSHSGSVHSLDVAIRFHFDPLRDTEFRDMNGHERTEYYARLKAWAQEGSGVPHLTDQEVRSLTSFLETLSFY